MSASLASSNRAVPGGPRVDEPKQSNTNWKEPIAAGAAAVLGGACAPAAAIGGVQALGFTTSGIVAKSTAACMMKSLAVGGSTAAGGLVSTLQGVGATGLLGAYFAPTVVFGALAAAVTVVAASHIVKKVTKKIEQHNEAWTEFRQKVTQELKEFNANVDAHELTFPAPLNKYQRRFICARCHELGLRAQSRWSNEERSTYMLITKMQAAEVRKEPVSNAVDTPMPAVDDHHPVAEPIAMPVAEPAVEPSAEPVAEPVVESVAESVVESATSLSFESAAAPSSVEMSSIESPATPPPVVHSMHLTLRLFPHRVDDPSL